MIGTGQVITSGVSEVLPAAVKYDNSILVSFWFEKGVNINTRDSNGQTACHVVAYQSNLDMVEVLLDGVTDASAKNKRGETARNILEDRRSFYTSSPEIRKRSQQLVQRLLQLEQLPSAPATNDI